MTRRRLTLLALFAVVTAALAVWLVWPRSAINRENYEKIDVGMTLAEVEAILEGPARDESSGPTMVAEDLPKELCDVDDPRAYETNCEVFDMNGRRIFARKEWISNHLTILVDFGADERVKDTYVFRRRLIAESPLNILSRWLHL